MALVSNNFLIITLVLLFADNSQEIDRILII